MATRTGPQDDAAPRPAELLEPVVPDHPAQHRWRWLRIALGAALAVAFVLVCWRRGIPLDRFQLFAWMWAAALCWGIGRSWRTQWGFLRDWVPVLAVLLAYDYSAGVADLLGAPLHITAMADVDRTLFGGVLPTHWLQDRLYRADVQWYDAVLAVVYFSHFLVCMAIAAVLWFRNRSRWAAFLRRFLTVSVCGVLGYVVFPAAPPWWAADHGYLSAVPRLTSRGWELLGVPLAGAVISEGQARANLVAAIPSLHAAFSLLAVLFFLPRVRRRWWPLLLAYPATMALALVYFGEHYVLDVLVGWALVVVVFVVVVRLERWWRRRRTGAGPTGGDGRVDADPDARRRRLRLGIALPVAAVALAMAGNVVAAAAGGGPHRPDALLVEAPPSAIGGGRCSAVVYAMLNDTPDALSYGYPAGVDDRRLREAYGSGSAEVAAFAELQPVFVAQLQARPPGAPSQTALDLLRGMRDEVGVACRRHGGS